MTKEQALRIAQEHYAEFLMSNSKDVTVKEATDFWRIVVEALKK